MKYLLKSLILVTVMFLSVQNVFADLNLHLIEAQTSNEFAIYRTGKPKKLDMRLLCQLGISEIMVLSGNAEEAEFKYQDECPTLKVIYNEVQSSKVALTQEFLETFDQWVEEARITGKKIAFRCDCGCHRTGRLAAYYNMKYLDWDADRALEDMNDKGKVMRFFRHLIPQVRDLRDFIDGKPCLQEAEACVPR